MFQVWSALKQSAKPEGQKAAKEPDAKWRAKKTLFLWKLFNLLKNHNIPHTLKGVWHEIFDFKIFSWISIPQAPKYSIGFLIFSNIRGDICKLMFITGVVETGDKLFSGVSDTGVVDTGEQFIFPRCRWYHSEKKLKSLKCIAGVNNN